MNSPTSPMFRDEQPLDELVLMSTSQLAGPPMLDGSEMGFGASNANDLRGASSLFPDHTAGLDDVTDPGLLSLLTGDIDSMQDRLSPAPLLGDDFQHELRQNHGRPLQATPPPPPATGTMGSSNRAPGDAKQADSLPPLSATHRHAPGDHMELGRALLGELNEMAAQEFTRISSNAASSGAPPPATIAKRPPPPAAKKRASQPAGQANNLKGKAASRAAAAGAGGGGGGANDVNSNILAKTKEAMSLTMGGDKENGAGQKQTRLRYSKGAAPSKYCHVCGRSAKTVSVALCGNNKLGLCRKVVCDKCLIMHQWGDFRSAKESESSWTCTHCRGDCPARARCHQYQRNNMRRRLKSNGNQAAAAGGSAGPTGLALGGGVRPRPGAPGGAAGAAANPPLQQPGRGPIRPPGGLGTLGSLGSLGVGKFGSASASADAAGGVGGAKGMVPADLTPTNIMGAAGDGVFQTTSLPGGLPPVVSLSTGPATSSLYSSFNFLE
jgi:hypothetical protein